LASSGRDTVNRLQTPGQFDAATQQTRLDVFHKILIANRGEIACRIIDTARKMGVLTVAVYSDADRDSLHVSMADEAIHIGPAPSRESYLQSQRVIDAAIATGAEAIHPGYGFLSENADFARLCVDNQLVFIGPPVAAIKAMGSKSAAKSIMEEAGVPLVLGYHGENQDSEIIRQAAEAMGYPVLLKASAGGGGKGMRQVWSAAEFDEALAAAKREALGAFNDENMLVEKYLQGPRHVEIQVFFDSFGEGVYLAERDCSIQRRHQKVIEEAPAPGIDPALRQAMGETALRAAAAIDYQGAGTVEFLLDSEGQFYFMEMNTRLQVEHPVTEMITGQDLVEWQLRVASGEPLPLRQEQIVISGHAFEARIYAEDPANDFLPVSGKLSYLSTPIEDLHTRIDTGVRQGDDVSVYYDPMIAKLVVWDTDRDSALRRLSAALSHYRIGGMTTNIDFLYNLSLCRAFKAAELDTGFIEQHRSEIFGQDSTELTAMLPQAALYLLLEQQQQASARSNFSNDHHSPWHQANGWRLNHSHRQQLSIHCLQSDTEHAVTVEQCHRNGEAYYRIDRGGQVVEARGAIATDNDQSNPRSQRFLSDINGHRQYIDIAKYDGQYTLYSQRGAFAFCQATTDIGEQNVGAGDSALTAPMNGTVVALLVAPYTSVEKDQPLMVMEAMKMEHTIKAPYNGHLLEFYYQPGDLVEGGAELLNLQASESDD